VAPEKSDEIIASRRCLHAGDRIVSIRAIGCGSDIADTSSSRRPITCSPSKNERNFSNWRPCYLRLAFDNQNGSAALVMWRGTSAQGQNLARPLKQGQNAAGKAGHAPPL
jgi:hypothetical protein